MGAGISRLAGTSWFDPWSLWLLGPWATAPLVCALVTWPLSRRVPDSTFVPLAGAIVMPTLAFLLGAWPTFAVTVATAVVLLLRPKAATDG